MYSYEQRKKAVELYIQYGKHASTVIHELGYPNRHSLALWYKEFEKSSDLHKKRVRSPKNIQKDSFRRQSSIISLMANA